MSRAYRLTSGAESDVRKILEYTLERWGPKQAAKYASLLEDAIEKPADRELAGRGFSTNLPDVRVHRCEHHYIFFQPGDQSLLILAILNKSMDLMTRLRERLGDQESRICYDCLLGLLDPVRFVRVKAHFKIDVARIERVDSRRGLSCAEHAGHVIKSPTIAANCSSAGSRSTTAAATKIKSC